MKRWIICVYWSVYHAVRALGRCRPCGGSGIEPIVGYANDVIETPCGHCGGSGRWRL